ncbi:MAG: hypothetical protein M5R40_02130 [Anaerolineae bacterium]|nr:hypothetical protein [Anaerolineae bacterium]
MAALQRSHATGELNRQAERWGKKSKKHPVNELLFAQLTEWRHELFRQIRGWNPNLWTQDLRAVDNAVQRLIDRLIFIRTVEDRGIERPGCARWSASSRTAARRTRTFFADLLALFRELDTVYDANLFAESSLDHLALHDPLLLTRIIDGLYGLPGGYISYDFNAIDADVLGAIYEQYLSFKAQDPEGKAVIDLEKRSKRKAQGIYYTPQFVVRYIVQEHAGQAAGGRRRPARAAHP